MTANRSKCMLAATLAALLSIGVVVATDALSADAEVERLIGLLRAAPPTEIDATIHRLATKGSIAIPALAKGLDDLAIQAECVEALILMPAELAGPVLRAAIDRAPIASSRQRLGKAYLIASLGVIGSSETVPYLEDLYDREADKTGRVALHIAWALRHITGREYGPTANDRDGCRQRVGIEAK